MFRKFRSRLSSNWPEWPRDRRQKRIQFSILWLAAFTIACAFTALGISFSPLAGYVLTMFAFGTFGGYYAYVACGCDNSNRGYLVIFASETIAGSIYLVGWSLTVLLTSQDSTDDFAQFLLFAGLGLFSFFPSLFLGVFVFVVVGVLIEIHRFTVRRFPHSKG